MNRHYSAAEMFRLLRIAVVAVASFIGFFLPVWGQKTISPILQKLQQVLSEPSAVANNSPSVFKLNADAIWQLQPSGESRFDASALLLSRRGLVTVNDKDPAIYRIDLSRTNVAKLSPVSLGFGSSALKPWMTNKQKTFDFEGLAMDDHGRFYLCEEIRRAIFRFDPVSGKVERLPIDWAPVQKYFAPRGKNASFEGVAVGGGMLYVANERSDSRIVVVDLSSMKVIDHFLVKSQRYSFIEPHYTDLSWFDGHLYVLLRHQRTILEVDPAKRQVLAEYEFDSIEQNPNVEYLNDYPTGTMEGLAVDDAYFYLVTDNNGKGRKKFPKDSRPTLFRCPRPVERKQLR